jgi:multiple sugar transport system substrate-binding protein
VGVVLAALMTACGSSGSSPGSSGASSGPTPSDSSSASSSPSPLPPQTITFGVVGSAGEVAQYRTMAATFVMPTREVTVKVESWPSDSAMLAAFRHGARVPDVFLASRRHLPYLTQHQLVQPLDAVLEDRGFDLGDEFPRSSLTAFASDNHLMCLPYGVQPAVIFYNKQLVRFGKIKNNPPTAGQGWSLDQFAAAARWATRHHPGVAGAELDPSLSGIAPFVYSGGGQLFDSTTTPTTLTLSDGTNLTTLSQTVRALHASGAGLSSAQLQRRTPLQWFRKGKLAMLEGSRDLVPTLRATAGLDFDVMPMPSLSSSATVGSLTGLCLSQHASDVSTASDFLVYASSPGALALVSFAGYLQPANQSVALSDAFQQPDRLPVHASVFTFSVKSMVFPPAIGQWDDLENAVDPLVETMLESSPSGVPRLARRVDRASYRVIGPRLGPTISPSASPQ